MFIQQHYKMGIVEKIKSFFGGETINFEELIDKGAIIVDVRTPAEFKAGHHKQSKNLPLQNLGNQLAKLNGKEVVLVCKSGVRAGLAKRMLTKAGIKAHNAGAWQNLN